MEKLRTGDPCPCCGQPIKVTDPRLLDLLTYIRDTRCNIAACEEYSCKTAAESNGGDSDV